MKEVVNGIMSSIDENSRFFIPDVGQISDFKINEIENPGKPTRGQSDRSQLAPHLRYKHNVMDADFKNEWRGEGMCDAQWNVELSDGTVEINYHAGGPDGGKIYRAIEVGKHPIITGRYANRGKGREFVEELGSRINGKIKEDQERRGKGELRDPWRVAAEVAAAKKKKAEEDAAKEEAEVAAAKEEAAKRLRRGRRRRRRRAQRIQQQRETAEVEQLREFARRKAVEQEQPVTKEELVELLKQQEKIIEQQNKKLEEISLEMKEISLEMKELARR